MAKSGTGPGCRHGGERLVAQVRQRHACRRCRQGMVGGAWTANWSARPCVPQWRQAGEGVACAKHPDPRRAARVRAAGRRGQQKPLPVPCALKMQMSMSRQRQVLQAVVADRMSHAGWLRQQRTRRLDARRATNTGTSALRRSQQRLIADFTADRRRGSTARQSVVVRPYPRDTTPGRQPGFCRWRTKAITTGFCPRRRR